MCCADRVCTEGDERSLRHRFRYYRISYVSMLISLLSNILEASSSPVLCKRQHKAKEKTSPSKLIRRVSQAGSEWKCLGEPRKVSRSRSGRRRPPVWQGHRRQGRNRNSFVSFISGLDGTFWHLILSISWHQFPHLEAGSQAPRGQVGLRQEMSEGHLNRQCMTLPCLESV
jgi:hypothetical protein